MDTRTILRADIGFCEGIVFIGPSAAIFGIHVLLSPGTGHRAGSNQGLWSGPLQFGHGRDRGPNDDINTRI